MGTTGAVAGSVLGSVCVCGRGVAVLVSYWQLICVCVDPVSLARWLSGLINLALSVSHKLLQSCSCPCIKLTFDFSGHHCGLSLSPPSFFVLSPRLPIVSGVVVCMI